MNTIVEITDMLGIDYYYVSATFEGNKLVLKKPKGLFAKIVEYSIKLSEVRHICARDERGIERLTFFYDRNWYTFNDYGNNLVACLKERFA